MKRILTALFFTALILLSLFVTASAKTKSLEKDYVKDGEFTLISYQGFTDYLKKDKLETFEDSIWNLLNQKDSLNVKHVTFMGPFTTGSTYTYASVVTKGGKTSDELYNLCLNDDKVWLEQYINLADTAKILNEEHIPYAVNYSFTDYPATTSGSFIKRVNHQTTYFGLVDTVEDGVEYDSLNDSNFYIVVENNGVKYMIFQIEVWPSEAALDWFNKAMESNPDKYAIVYTTSFTDASGKMITMWDRTLKGSELTAAKSAANTRLKVVNLQNVDKPRDGDGIWNYSFSKFDNILAIVSNNATTNDLILTKETNERGFETAVITANTTELAKSMGPLQLAIKISEDNKTVSVRYLVPFEGYIDTTDKSVTFSKVATLAEPKKVIPKIESQYNGANKSYIVGYDGNLFKPQNNMRRSEACTIFARLILGTQDIPAGYTTRFTDVKEGQWYYNAVAFLDESGFFEQLTSNKYDPEGYITRAEFVDLANKASSLVVNKTLEFSDVDADHFYYDSIMAAAGSGLVGGYTDGTFKPDKTITRAEVVTVLNRLLGISATDKNISPDKLSTKFGDIDTHWARLDILMASNSNVHGEYYYNATLNGVTETDRAYIFKNNRFEFTLEKGSARISSFKNLETGEDVNNNSADPYFIYQTKLDGGKVLPTGVLTDGNRLCFTFKNGTKVYMLVEVLDDFMTFEIDSGLAPGIANVTFANFVVKPDYDNYRLNGMGMTAWCEPTNRAPYGEFSQISCIGYETLGDGAIGSKYGVSFAKTSDAIEVCQKVADYVDTSVGLASKAGGAYAREWSLNFADYLGFNDIKPENVDTVIALCKKYGVHHFTIHQTTEKDSGDAFLSGTFEWLHFDSHEDFYERFGKKLHENGITYGLHSYTHYISYDAHEFTANPYWQKQIQTVGDVYTVRKATTERSANITTVEDATNFDTTTSYFVANSKYVLIDEEIISVGQGTTSGFINCKRGLMGTTPARHYPGTKIYHLAGHFGLLTPLYGSELFYEVADRMADAYNRAGFDMLYFDAIDGMTGDTNKFNYPEGARNYYSQMFVHRVVSQCNRTPVVETAAGSAQEYNVRGKIGAADTPHRGIKLAISSHTTENLKKIENNMVTTLGWFAFYTDRKPTRGMYNTLEKTLFHDDLDLLGLQSIIYDQTMVYNILPAEGELFHEANIKYFNKYAELRNSHYFTQATRDKLAEMGGEFKLIEKENGEYAFLQMYYNKSNVGNFAGADGYTFEINNPCSAQTPFVRVESRWSTDNTNEMLLIEFDENKTLSSQKLTHTGLSFDLRNNAVLKFKVKGTGGSKDALLISLTGAGLSTGRIDFFVDLNYEGWREYTVLDSDNAEYDTNKYSFSGISNYFGAYDTVRSTPTYQAIGDIAIRTYGTTAKNAQMSNIYAYKQNIAPVENPTVTVGGSSITFNTTINGGDYIEYEPDTNKAYLYNNRDNTITEISFTGLLSVPAGKSTGKYTATNADGYPVRAKVVFGFAGETVENIK